METQVTTKGCGCKTVVTKKICLGPRRVARIIAETTKCEMHSRMEIVDEALSMKEFQNLRVRDVRYFVQQALSDKPFGHDGVGRAYENLCNRVK